MSWYLVTSGCILPVLPLQGAARGAGTSWSWSTVVLPMPLTLQGQLLTSLEEKIRKCKPRPRAWQELFSQINFHKCSEKAGLSLLPSSR